MKKNLKFPHNNVYTKLSPSKIHGIGVFAIQNIPKDKNIFLGDTTKMIWLNKSMVKKLAPEIKKLYNDFCVIKGNKYGCPDNFNNLTVAWYLNDSKKPNVRCGREYDFFASRNIKKDEELTISYSSYSDDI